MKTVVTVVTVVKKNFISKIDLMINSTCSINNIELTFQFEGQLYKGFFQLKYPIPY